MDFLNIIVVLTLFAITFKTLNQKDILREKNKYKTSLLILQNIYETCLIYISDILDENTIEKFIIPKIDFNTTQPQLIKNLQDDPFENENIFMEFVKDGQIDDNQITSYLNIKSEFRQLVTQKIIFLDKNEEWKFLEEKIRKSLEQEVKKIAELIQNKNIR